LRLRFHRQRPGGPRPEPARARGGQRRHARGHELPLLRQRDDGEPFGGGARATDRPAPAQPRHHGRAAPRLAPPPPPGCGAVPNYASTIVVGECLSRANESHGYTLDLDGIGSVLLERVVATGNGGHGLHVTSETQPGILLASSSALTGNLGFGVRAEGPAAS